MKPERIQFADLIQAMIWGVFQILRFETPAKAQHFVDFIHDMADNHGRNAACKLDETHTQVTLLVAANADGDIAEARMFADQVLDIFAVWSAADEVIPSDEEISPDELN